MIRVYFTGDCDGFVATCRKVRFWDRAAAER